MIKGRIYQKDIIVLTLYLLNNAVSKHIKEKIKGTKITNKSTAILGDSKFFFSISDRIS